MTCVCEGRQARRRAGQSARDKLTADLERHVRAGLQTALDAGYEILKRSGSSLDAVEAAS